MASIYPLRENKSYCNCN